MGCVCCINRNNFGAETSVGASKSSSSSQRVGRWGEGEKVFPLKKRRESFEQKVNKEMIMEKEKKTKAKMKTKTNKKWVHAEEEDDEEENQESADGQPISASSLKKRGSGGTNMEGSRCSRVNGRGWRCCQQTLVGYSLCEHHLGKGRLRSMSSVRNRSSAVITKSKKEEEILKLSSLQSQKSLEFDEDEEEDEDEKPFMIKKKRKKIGMVKARSMSSLLGLTQIHAISATPQPPADDNHSSTSKVHDIKL